MTALAAWQLTLSYDYGQIYLHSHPLGEGDDQQELLGEAFADGAGRMARGENTVVVLPEGHTELDVALRVELWAAAPPADLDGWDDVWEASLPVSADGLGCSSCMFDGAALPPLPPGSYGMRIFSAGERLWSYPEREEQWLFQFWPVDAPLEARQLKARPGWSDGERALWAGAEAGAVEQRAAFLRGRAVADGEAAVRKTAVALLGGHFPDHPATAPFLLERAGADPAVTVRLEAVQAAVQWTRDHPDVEPWLRAHLSDSRPDVRWAAVRALTKRLDDWREVWEYDPELAPVLRELAERDPEPWIRRYAGVALAGGCDGDPAVLAWLRDRAAVGSDPDVAAAAVRAVLGAVDATWLRKRTGSPHATVRAAAAQALGDRWRDDAAARAWLVELAEHAEQPDLRRAAVLAIAQHMPIELSAGDLGELVRARAAGDPDPDVRWAAMREIPSWYMRLMESQGHHPRNSAAERALREAWAWWERQQDAERDLLAAVLAAGDPVAPPAAPEPPTWENLLELMAHGPDVAIRGAIRSRGWPTSGVFAFAVDFEGPPILAGVRPHRDAPDHEDEPPLRVWWKGKRLRIEEPDGAVNLIAGPKTCWQFQAGTDVPTSGRRRTLLMKGSGTEILTRGQAQKWQQYGVGEPVGRIEHTMFLGRPAWAVEVREHDEDEAQLVVDAETGLILQLRDDTKTRIDEWVEFVVGEQFDDDLFTWAGPTRSAEEWEAAQIAAAQDAAARAARWFAEQVGPEPLRVEVDLTPYVYDHDEATGAFTASLGASGRLARRPRSSARWGPEWEGAQHRWRTERWDWVLAFHGDPPTAGSIEAVKRRLAD